MWEFSLNLKSENFNLAKKIFLSLNNFISKIDGVVTSHEEQEYISILIAIKEKDIVKVQTYISDCVVESICSDFKMKYLDKYLILPEYDKIGMIAFKKALLNFDKETDKFIVRKNLNLEKDVFLESFYYFKLKSLQEKWAELVSLSNENRDYLLSSESFVDLLKFLVDNLDIEEDEISVVKEDGGYRIYIENNNLFSNKLISEESIVSSVIDLCPQKINLYFNESSKATNLLEKIFKERITINNSSLKNIKNFHIN